MKRAESEEVKQYLEEKVADIFNIKVFEGLSHEEMPCDNTYHTAVYQLEKRENIAVSN